MSEHGEQPVDALRERAEVAETDKGIVVEDNILLKNENERLEADLAAALEEIKQLKGILAARDRGLARQAWLLKNVDAAHRPAHRPAAERRYLDRVLALEQRIEGLEGVLRRAHACATLREDGTCEGCFVSEALGPAPESL